MLRLFLLLVAVTTGLPETRFDAKVVAVADGDTITVLSERQQTRIRLDGIDCPERGQAFGSRAKQFTSALVFGREVTIEPRDVDRYGRMVARVYVDDKDVSLELVKAGFAWHYKHYSADTILAQAEIDARDAKSGLWADFHATAPWEFRHPSPGTQSRVASLGPFHGNLRSKVFHAPGCQHYDCANCRQPFASTADAEAAGYRRHAACVR
jgi:endonuclease YncB( thermonuclease family)